MSRRLLQIRSSGIAAWLRAIAFLLAVALLGSIPSAASAQPSPCANGIAVPDPANNPGLVADCDSLLSARDTLAGTATLDWSADLAIGNWEGVTVSGTPPRVITLDLPFRQLKGTIPDDLGSLTNLTDLSLGYNELNGEIPAELGGLTNLTDLSLGHNQLSGEIPAEMGSLTNLLRLRLWGNQLSGEIPAELGGLTNLRGLGLNDNQLSGEIPAELGGLTNLTDLSLGHNQLSGEIPVEMGSLTNLLRLRLWGNQLSGEIPSELGSLTNLDQLYLYSNQLSGEIPAELGSLTNLTSLGLSANQLSGEIPAELDGLTNLTDLSLNANQLSGEIPSELGSLTNLTELHLHYNQLSGEIPSELGSLTNLNQLYLYSNQLSGEIPAELGSLTNLTRLGLSVNQLSGEIPAELGSLANLTRLYLSNNQLSGCIPSALRYVPNNDFAELGLLFCAAAPAPMMDVCIEALGDLANTELTGSWVDGCESEERNGSYARFYTFTLGQDSEVTLTLQSDDANTYLYLRQGNATSGTALHENDGHEGSRSVSQIQVTLSAGTYTIEATTYGEGETGSFALSVAGLGTAAGPTPSVPALWFDTESAPFDDPRVRYAISYAIDQELINEIFWDGRGDLQSPVPDALFPQWTTELDEPGVLQEWHLYDLGESRRLLAEAGYPDGLETRVHVLSRWAQWAEVIAEMLAEVGIVVDVVISDPAVIAALGQVSHQAMILAPLQGFGGDVAAFILEHFTDEGQHNYSRLDSDVPEEILSEFVGTEDTERRRELVYNLQNHLHERWFLVPLPAPPMPPASTDPCIEPLAGLATIIGDWDEDACASGVPGRGYARYFSFTVAQASEVTITLESEVDTYLYLRTGQDRSGEPLHENDDLASGNTNSRIQETLEAGAYTIEATTYNAGSTGSFTLTVSGLGGTNAPLPSPRPHAGDRAALVALYDATGGSNWVRSGGWGSDAPIDEWHGVSADGGGRVVGLNLPRNGLAGEIPQQLGSLARLRFLNLIGNQLSGEIPEELGNLTSLEQLGLGDNQLRGEIPSELGSLANLTELSLSGNELSGKIPSELGNLAGLTSLGLWSNQLSGEIPDELGNLLNLKSLALSFNRLSGEIPADMGSLTNLRRLHLGSNQLTGKIPPELGSLLNLESLGLRNNELTGKIPPELGNLTSLEELGLSDNHLSGEIPPELGKLTSLGNILFGRNQLTGEIPPELGDLLNLHSLYLYENELTGGIPPELGNLTNLTILRLDGNQLTGEIPVELSNLPNLIHLYLFDNELTGGILPELGNLTYLKTLLLYGNQFTGEILSELGRLSNLDRLDLGGNQLSGQIPSGLGSLSNLTELYLGGNQLGGEIPSELGNLSELGRLHLEDNQLTGTIPSWVGNLSNLRYLRLDDNQLTGTIPSGLGNLSNLAYLDLHNNQLAGMIPSSLGNLTNLQVLRIAGNRLTGCVPAALRDVEYNDFAQLGLPFCETQAVGEHSATRSFSATTVAPGGEITVNIALSEYGEGGTVTETLPEGFTFVPGSVEWTGGGGFVRPSGNRVWVVLAGAGVTNIIYKVTAPSEAGGPFEFTGKFVNFDGESVDIGGASTVTVAADAGTPASYDSNGNGIIELSELFVAIDDYFASEISLAVLFDIIDFYFSGERVG